MSPTRDPLERARALAEARNAELVEATAQIEHTSLHDALTQLPNRRFPIASLPSCCDAARRDGTAIGLLHLDVDRFKQINDTLATPPATPCWRMSPNVAACQRPRR